MPELPKKEFGVFRGLMFAIGLYGAVVAIWILAGWLR